MSGSVLPDVPAVSVVQFRTDYPEFDPMTYQDAQVTTFLIQGTALLDPARWGALYTMGVELYTAHFLALSRRSAMAGQGGLLGGTGMVSGKSVGRVAVNYDVSASINKAAGPFNLTVYGQTLFFWMQVFGMGAVQLTGNDGPAAPGSYQEMGLLTSGWSGPIGGLT